MAVIRDMIPPCELFQPASIGDALNLLDQYGENSWVLAGGLDSFDWFKDRISGPRPSSTSAASKNSKASRPMVTGSSSGR